MHACVRGVARWNRLAYSFSVVASRRTPFEPDTLYETAADSLFNLQRPIEELGEVGQNGGLIHD